MKKHFLPLALAAALALGLAVPALAAGQTFTDVPSSYWGYADIEAVAEAGLMKGTGGNQFSPEVKVSVAQFLTLLGRLVFPDVKTEGSDWFGPYVSAAKDAGLLNGTQVDTGNVEAEISRYDMAVILRAAAKKLGVAEKSAQSSEVKDFGVIPNMYTEAVLAVYGMGLIRGDQAGNFNGSNTMMRAEVATVIMRLAKAKPGGSTVTPDTDPEKPVDPRPETIHTAYYIRCITPEQFSENKQGERALSAVPLQFRYTEDGGKTSRLIAECTSYNTDGFDYVNLSLDVEKALVDNENGQFYFSGETEYNGQRLITQDLRADGRATIIPVEVKETSSFNWATVEMVPPTGFKRSVTINSGFGSYYYQRYHNVAVQFRYYPDPENTEYGGGILMGEAVLDKNGNYLMEFEMDTVDYKRDVACYRIEIYDAGDGTLLSHPDLKVFSEVTFYTRIKLD